MRKGKKMKDKLRMSKWNMRVEIMGVVIHVEHEVSRRPLSGHVARVSAHFLRFKNVP